VTAELLERTVGVFQDWLDLPDPAALYATLGTVAANRLDGDPVWLLLVGAPSSGKTEILQAVSSLDGVHPTASLTEAGLLSGSPARERTKDATGGLLRKVGEHGIILAKDFGSVLSLHADSRSQVLAALREVYDGSWTRNVGTDGGRTLHWQGKCGLIAGVTPTIDRHQAVMGTMGERFILLRLAAADPSAQAEKALEHRSRSVEMRDELAKAVKTLFEQDDLSAPERTEADKRRLIALAVFVVRCRSAVERDGRTREIELIPDAEAPARLVLTLDRLLDGLLALGTEHTTAWGIVEAAALGSIPRIRRAALQALYPDGVMSLSEISEAIDYPRRTSERALEDLVAHRVLSVERCGSGKPTLWKISLWTADNWPQATFPEISDGISPRTFPEISEGICPDSETRSNRARTHKDDKSGKVVDLPLGRVNDPADPACADQGSAAGARPLPLSVAVGADPASDQRATPLADRAARELGEP
jgi:hypothetical protein